MGAHTQTDEKTLTYTHTHTHKQTHNTVPPDRRIRWAILLHCSFSLAVGRSLIVDYPSCVPKLSTDIFKLDYSEDRIPGTYSIQSQAEMVLIFLSRIFARNHWQSTRLHIMKNPDFAFLNMLVPNGLTKSCNFAAKSSWLLAARDLRVYHIKKCNATHSITWRLL